MFVMTSIRARAAIRPISVACAIALLTLPSVAQERDRAKIPDKYKWNLADIYPTEAAWRAAKDKLQADIPQIAQFKGNARPGRRCWPTRSTRCTRSTRNCRGCYVYASMLADQDTRDAAARGHAAGDGAARRRRFSAEASYIEPEILRFRARHRREVSRGRTAAEGLPLLSRGHRAPRAAHARATPRRRFSPTPARSPARPSNIYNILVERRFSRIPTVTLSDGRTVEVDQAGVQRASRRCPNRADRQKVMSAFFGALGGFSRTFGTTMNGEVAEGAVLRQGAEVSDRRSRRRSTARTFRCRSTRA